MKLPTEIIEYICSLLITPDLKSCRLVNKDMNRLIKRIVQRRIPNIHWDILKKSCFLPFRFPVETGSQVKFINSRYLLCTKMIYSALETIEGESVIGKHKVSIWSFADNCYVLNEIYDSCQFIFSFVTDLCIIYSKSNSLKTTCNIYSFYKDEPAAHYSFGVNKSDLAILENPSISIPSFISPDGKYMYSFSNNAILSHTGKVFPVTTCRKFDSNVAISSRYCWIENNIFKIDGCEFECKTPLTVKVQKESLMYIK